MAMSQMSEVIRHPRTVMVQRDGTGLTDWQLLEDDISRRDESALAALVRRPFLTSSVSRHSVATRKPSRLQACS
jgi:hypothetical protein